MKMMKVAFTIVLVINVASCQLLTGLLTLGAAGSTFYGLGTHNRFFFDNNGGHGLLDHLTHGHHGHHGHLGHLGHLGHHGHHGHHGAIHVYPYEAHHTVPVHGAHVVHSSHYRK